MKVSSCTVGDIGEIWGRHTGDMGEIWAVLVEGEQLHGGLVVDLELHTRGEAARARVDLVGVRVQLRVSVKVRARARAGVRVSVSVRARVRVRVTWPSAIEVLLPPISPYTAPISPLYLPYISRILGRAPSRSCSRRAAPPPWRWRPTPT